MTQLETLAQPAINGVQAPVSGVLVSMPWATIIRPSLAIGILTRVCEERSIPVTAIHANLDMAARIGVDAASLLADDRTLYGMADHFFACDLYGPDAIESNKFLKVLEAMRPAGQFRDRAFVRKLRDQVIPAFLDDLTERVLALEPTFVGFSATFNQVMGSLALARRLKRARPGIVIIAGGACFDGEMGQEYHRALPDTLDHVFMGEGEESFREFLRRLEAAEPTTGIPGVTWHDGTDLHLVPGRALPDLSQSPMPTYDAYFRQKRELQAQGLTFEVESLPFESSRGCWWGQNSHCMFCGINDDVMAFREKDLETVIAEMVSLSSRYRITKLTAADWIVSRRQRKAIFQRLADLDYDLECFYETRADLTKEEIALMRAAGVLTIQPGIESLSTELLTLMGKGTSRIRVVQFLRWAREYGIDASYNILGGFPGEDPDWYLEMAAFVPNVVHLQPPGYNMGFVEMHRFSPLFENKERWGVEDYEIRPDYLFNFPEGAVDLLKVGYFFNYRSKDLPDRSLYEGPIRKAIGAWINLHQKGDPPRFEYRISPGFTRVTDTRGPAPRRVDLAGLPQDVLLLADQVQVIGRLSGSLAAKYPAEVEAGAVEQIVDQFVEGGLMMREGQMVLTLPIGHKARTTRQIHAHVLGADADTAEDEAVPVVQAAR